MEWQEVPAPRRKADYAGKRLRLLETPPKQRHQYDPSPELPIQPGDMAQIWMRRSFRDAECMDVDIKSWPEGRTLAPAVATKEATDGDSNWLPRRAFNAVTVAIRKPADAGNGYRELRWKCPFCAALHSVLIPESWIAEGKAVFVEPTEGE